jgi:uncharacterized protein (TIGR00288 family)
MNAADSRSTRIAVFIDFDNVEIGVKSTIGGQFDIGLVLEAIKERGEIVTKIAYSDWKRAGDYSRILTQHAIRMVQRSFTPGGDKNGADITMALDALEMAFTHDHISAFVIVGGDSDFISLVEKLKQYGRKVIVVGGRQFTSATMQKNCHEFIAYENLAGSRGRPSERGRSSGSSAIGTALPLVRRALKVLSEREVTPQLGLLKSTLLQLDSTFSERDYGASSFRDFMEKVAQAGAVTLRHSGRSMLVEAVDDVASGRDETVGASPAPPVVPAAPAPAEAPRAAAPAAMDGLPIDAEADEEETMPVSPMSVQDGIRAVQQAFTQASTPPRWPMYLRQAKQYLRNAIEGFDERKYGFASVVDLLRAAGKEGVVRIERDRQGAIRVFPGANMVQPAPSAADPVVELEETVDVEVPADRVSSSGASADREPPVEDVSDAPIVDAEPLPWAAGMGVASVDVATPDDEGSDVPVADAVVTGPESDAPPAPADPAPPVRRSRARKTPASRASTATKTTGTRTRARKTTKSKTGGTRSGA